MASLALKERDLHKALVKKLKELQNVREFMFFHVKNDVGGRGKNFFYDLKPLGVLPGVSDFVFMKPNGKIAFLEIKTERGKLSDNQKRFIDKADKLGHKVLVAYGWDQINTAVDEILAA